MDIDEVYQKNTTARGGPRCSQDKPVGSNPPLCEQPATHIARRALDPSRRAGLILNEDFYCSGHRLSAGRTALVSLTDPKAAEATGRGLAELRARIQHVADLEAAGAFDTPER